MSLKELREIQNNVEESMRGISILNSLDLLPDEDKFWNRYSEFLKNSAEEAGLIHYDPRKHQEDYIMEMISKKIKRMESEIITDCINSDMGLNIE